MPSFHYDQRTGNLTNSVGVIIGAGYSGRGAGRMNPEFEHVHNVGPLPRGEYIIGHAVNSNHVGPFAIPLTPVPGQEMHGRSAFFMHGDSTEHPGLASDGCIVMAQKYRQLVAKWVGGVLLVT